MDSDSDTACAVGCPIRRSEDQRALAPPLGFSQRATSFIASRCQGIHQMPFMCRARAQTQARPCACLAEIGWQRSELRPAQRRLPGRTRRLLTSDICSLISGARTPPRPMLAHRPHIPMPRPDLPGGMAGPASRSRLASRFQRTEDRDQRTDQTVRHAQFSVITRGPDVRRRTRDLCPLFSVFCHLSLPTPGWWAWADLNGRPHAYQACALTN